MRENERINFGRSIEQLQKCGSGLCTWVQRERSDNVES